MADKMDDPPPGYDAANQAANQVPPPPQARPMFVVQGPIAYREVPVTLECPACKAHVTTGTRYELGLLAWLVFAVTLLTGFWMCCLCFVPFCVDALKDVDHYCPSCGAVCGRYKRMG